MVKLREILASVFPASESRVGFPEILARALVMAVLAATAGSVVAQPAGQEAQIQAIRDVLTRTQPNMTIQAIKPSQVAGLFEVSIQNGQVIYASADARYFIPGDLYEARAEGLVNLGEIRRNAGRAAKIAAIDESDMVVFEANGERKAALTVFTDVDCPFCRQLHSEVPKLNAMGIAVRYLAFPRTGLDTETYPRMVSVWCSDDRQAMLTSAKRGGDVPAAECDNPVADQYRLGREVGVTGTPALVFPDGTIVPGYVPAETLSGYLLGSE